MSDEVLLANSDLRPIRCFLPGQALVDVDKYLISNQQHCYTTTHFKIAGVACIVVIITKFILKFFFWLLNSGVRDVHL